VIGGPQWRSSLYPQMVSGAASCFCVCTTSSSLYSPKRLRLLAEHESAPSRPKRDCKSGPSSSFSVGATRPHNHVPCRLGWASIMEEFGSIPHSIVSTAIIISHVHAACPPVPDDFQLVAAVITHLIAPSLAVASKRINTHPEVSKTPLKALSACNGSSIPQFELFWPDNEALLLLSRFDLPTRHARDRKA
jgi:hypothetical protein